MEEEDYFNDEEVNDGIVMPRVGGIMVQGHTRTPWTGGGNTMANERVRAKSAQAQRPIDPKTNITHDKNLRVGFKEEHMKLGTLEETKSKDYKGARFRDWMDDLNKCFINDGRDTVLWI